MKTKFLILSFVSLLFQSLLAQIPIVYVNFVSHNEPADNLQNSLNFLKMEPKVQQLAGIMDSKGASWNLETCDGFAAGALNFQGAANNVFRTITSGVYSDNIEVDPRYKQSIYPNIADLYHILDSLGAKPSTTLGGFIYATTNPGSFPIDWFQFQDSIQGISFPKVKWKCDLMYGAGSYPPHTNDLNDYGIWKPNTEPDFYTHNPSRKTWHIGNGCQPLGGLDSTENHQIIISGLHSFVDSIQNGLLPQDKFYAYTVMINQAHFGPTLFQKITAICDSINSWGSSKIQWATLSEKLTLFKDWQLSSGLDHSQWLCGQKTADLAEVAEQDQTLVYPNPSSGVFSIRCENAQKSSVKIYDNTGRLILMEDFETGDFTIDLSTYQNGLYFLALDEKIIRLIKE